MKGKIAREIRKLINYKENEITPPRLMVKRKEKGMQFVLDPNGPHKIEGKDIRYNFKEVERDICQLHADPVRQLYKDVKKQWYKFNRTDKRSQNKKETA